MTKAKLSPRSALRHPAALTRKMARASLKQNLDRVVAGLESGEFELIEFLPTLDQPSTIVIQMVLRRTTRRLEPGSGKPRPKKYRGPPKQNRQLIFE
jgi:hypothetical protein